MSWFLSGQKLPEMLPVKVQCQLLICRGSFQKRELVTHHNRWCPTRYEDGLTVAHTQKELEWASSCHCSVTLKCSLSPFSFPAVLGTEPGAHWTTASAPTPSYVSPVRFQVSGHKTSLFSRMGSSSLILLNFLPSIWQGLKTPSLHIVSH